MIVQYASISRQFSWRAFVAGPDGTKVLDIPRTLDNTFDVTCPRIHVFSAAVGLKSFQGEVRPFHLEFLEKLPRGQGIHHSDDKFQAGDNNGRSSPFSGNFIDSKREQPRFVVIAKGLSGLEQEYELGISQTEVSKMAAWIGLWLPLCMHCGFFLWRARQNSGDVAPLHSRLTGLHDPPRCCG